MAQYDDDPATPVPTGADSYRPLGQIMRDIKKEDAAIASACSRREALVRELRQVADAAVQYAENTECVTPSACSPR